MRRIWPLTSHASRITYFPIAKEPEELEMATLDEVKGWLSGRLPKEWYTGTPEVRMDEDEIWVIGTLPDVSAPAAAEAVKAAREVAIQRFRETTRKARIKMAGEGRERFR